MVVARLNLTAGRVVGTDVARHAALVFGDERDVGNQLGRLITVAPRIDQAQRSPMFVGQWSASHVEHQQHAR